MRFQEDDATARRWIIGLGYVDTVRTSAVESQSVAALGALVGERGVQVGLIQTHRTAIDPSLTGDALVKVDSSPLRLTVATRSVTSPTDHP